MEICLQLLLLAVGFVLLIKGADWFVDGAAGVAARLKIPQLVIGLTVVAMGTSAPEAAVSISSALKQNADITVGNIVGSNILNVLLILGISSVIMPLAVRKTTVRYEIPFLFGITALLLLQGFDGTIQWADGLVLLLCFVAYLVYLLITAKAQRVKEEAMPVGARKMWLLLLLTAAGLVLIIAGSSISVDAASAIAKSLGISERFIGLTVVALGTSLPELFTSVAAAKKGNVDIAIGNIVGSNIFNILFVIGLSAVIVPVPFAMSFRFDVLVALLSTLVLFLFCLRKKLTRVHGVIMLVFYLAYFAAIL